MISAAEKKEILDRAYVPEHLVGLMTLVSGGEPFLIDGYFCVRTGNHLIVVGFPLDRDFQVEALAEIVRRIIEMFSPASISLVAPELAPSVERTCRERESDRYYTLDLQRWTMPSALKRQVAGAAEHLRVERARKLLDSHHELSVEFVARVNPAPRVRELLLRMAQYVGHSDDSLVLNAWNRENRLSAFYVVDLAPAKFSTYVIGCHSKENYVRGASDLLFLEMTNVSKELGKAFIHLGLGVNGGIRRFKEKWGGVPGLTYEMCEWTLKKPSIMDGVRRHLLGR